MKSRLGMPLVLSCVVLLWSVPGFAQGADDDDPVAAKADATAVPKAAPSSGAANATDEAEKPATGAEGAAHESLVKPKVSEPEEPPPVGPVERLPPTAYPEWKTRGISGGSLWMSGSMHGMPWPYYPKTGIGVSGSVWIDTGYEKIDRGQKTDGQLKQLVSDGRAVLRVTPTYSADSWFVQGQTEFVGNKDQSVGNQNVVQIDDLWIRLGQWKKWNLQLGRFEAFEVYHFGMGMDVNTLERLGASGNVPPPDVFELGGRSNIVYRPSGVTNLAVHVYPTDFLRLELLGQFGSDFKSGLDTMGIRPAAVLDFGFLKLKAAFDARKQFPTLSSNKEQVTLKGGSAAAQFVFDPYLEFGANLAYGSVTHYSSNNSTDPNATLGDFDTAGSVTDLDVGGFANVRATDGVIVGAGVNEDQEIDKQSGSFSHVQGFGAVQVLVLKQLYVKAVGAYAKAHFAPGGATAWDNTMYSGRVRLMYLF